MLLETLRALEVELHRAKVRSSRSALESLLHPSFREFGRSGAAYTREEILTQVSQASDQPTIWSQDFRLELLSERLALLTYRSAHVAATGELERRHANRSSLWQQLGGRWKMRFHQGTPTEAF
jgi:hypothetical protein